MTNNRVTKQELANNLSRSAKKLAEMTAALKLAKEELAETREEKVTAEEAAIQQDSLRRLEETAHSAAMAEIRKMLGEILAAVKKP